MAAGAVGISYLKQKSDPGVWSCFSCFSLTTCRKHTELLVETETRNSQLHHGTIPIGKLLLSFENEHFENLNVFHFYQSDPNIEVYFELRPEASPEMTSSGQFFVV